jgi:hypothetical protein
MTDDFEIALSRWDAVADTLTDRNWLDKLTVE